MKRSFVIALHVGYWVLYLLLVLLFILFLQMGAGVRTGPHGFMKILGFLKIMSMFTIVPGLVGFYTFYSLLFNRYLSTKKIAVLCFWGLLTILIAGISGFIGLNIITNGQIFRFNGIKETSIMVCFMSALALIHGIIALVMKGFISWYGDIKVKEELQQKNFQTELALVRSQLNPHFLFNTINNIDVLIEKDPIIASAYLNKLSDIMRFMLYETKPAHISLQKEIMYISKYIDLQKIRSANHDFVQFTTEGDAGGWMIAPMLFIPFIENAFKHSVNKRSGHAIVIRIKITAASISFYCENQSGGNLPGNDEAGGVGNALIQKRLDLLYPGKHTLCIEQENNIYKVHLSICKHEN